MKRWFLSSVVVGSFALTGCGGSLCDDFADTMNNMVEKAESCIPESQQGEFEEQLDQYIEECEEQYADASDAEKEKAEEALQKLDDCVDELDECSLDNIQEWGQDFSSCMEDLTDLGDIAALVEGVAAVEALAADFAPELVADACGIPAARIRGLARELAAAPSAAVYGRIGTCTVEFGTLTSWLVDVVNVNGENDSGRSRRLVSSREQLAVGLDESDVESLVVG